MLGEAAASAARTKNTYLRARYRRLAASRGKKRAIVAVGHSILIAIWHMISNNIDYHDLGADHFLNHTDPARQARRLIQQLHQLGYDTLVTISETPAQ